VKTAKGRRRKASAAARLRPFWLPIAIAVLLCSAAIGFALSWSGFNPSHVEVSGNRVVATADILARARIARNVNMWLQNTGAMRRRIETIPYVLSARVLRLPPSTIAISVRERRPFAVVLNGEQSALADRDLRVLALGDDPALPRFVLPDGTPLLPGDFLHGRAQRLRFDYDAMIAAHVVPLQLQYDRFGGLVATVRGGVRLLFGDEIDLSAKLPLVDPILAQVVRKQRHVAAVDLRAPRTPVIEFK
jgi:cell division protein FtsQ